MGWRERGCDVCVVYHATTGGELSECSRVRIEQTLIMTSSKCRWRVWLNADHLFSRLYERETKFLETFLLRLRTRALVSQPGGIG